MDQNAEAHHRYSEFESLRDNLSKLYPTFIIPPIPSKQTIGDYAVKQAKAKEDASMIARRKRLLQTFLNRLARHPILSNEHVFHRFLEGEVSWVCNCSSSLYPWLTCSRPRSLIPLRSRYFLKTSSKPHHTTPQTPTPPRHTLLYPIHLLPIHFGTLINAS